MNINKRQFTIRPPRIDDWEVFNTLQTDPDYQQFMPPTRIGPEEERLNKFRFICQNPNDTDIHMICLNESDLVIGWCFLSQTRQSAPAYEIAITIHRDYQGNGYGTEVFQALFDVASNAECIDQLWEQVHVDNRASLAIMRRFGFQEIDDERPDFQRFNIDLSKSE